MSEYEYSGLMAQAWDVLYGDTPNWADPQSRSLTITDQQAAPPDGASLSPNAWNYADRISTSYERLRRVRTVSENSRFDRLTIGQVAVRAQDLDRATQCYRSLRPTQSYLAGA